MDARDDKLSKIRSQRRWVHLSIELGHALVIGPSVQNRTVEEFHGA